MSALADSLAATQSRAIAALQRNYAAGTMDVEALTERLDLIGATDKLDQGYLIAALDVLREYGAETPNGNGNAKPAKAMSDAQRKLIERLADDRGIVAPDLAGLSMEKGVAVDLRFATRHLRPERLGYSLLMRWYVLIEGPLGKRLVGPFSSFANAQAFALGSGMSGVTDDGIVVEAEAP